MTATRTGAWLPGQARSEAGFPAELHAGASVMAPTAGGVPPLK
jgi:hypothetical protein